VRVEDLRIIRTWCCEGAGMRTFAKDDRISRSPSLTTGKKKTVEIAQKVAHNKQPVHGINTSCHKPGVFVDVFEIVLISSVPG